MAWSLGHGNFLNRSDSTLFCHLNLLKAKELRCGYHMSLLPPLLNKMAAS